MSEAMPAPEDMRLVVFNLGEEEFAVEVAQVQEIIEMQDITRLPRAPGFIKGILNLRGKILPVIDLRERLGLPESSSEAQRIVITQLEEQFVGMMVDSVTEVLPIAASALEPPPPLVADVSGAYLRGLARLDDRLLILMDLSRILSAEDVEALATEQAAAKGGGVDT